MTTINLSEGQEAALQQLFSAQLLFANKNADGFVKGEHKISIVTFTESVCIENTLIAVEITSAPKVKGALYEQCTFFLYKIGDEMYLVPSNLMVKMVEEKHKDKLFSKKPEEGKLLKTKENRIYGFVTADEIIELAAGQFTFKSMEAEK